MIPRSAAEGPEVNSRKADEFSRSTPGRFPLESLATGHSGYYSVSITSGAEPAPTRPLPSGGGPTR